MAVFFEIAILVLEIFDFLGQVAFK
jgi:hypothetical protein